MDPRILKRELMLMNLRATMVSVVIMAMMTTVGVKTQRQLIPGWEKVDALARALIQLDRLSVNNEEARNINTLYSV